MRKLLVISDSAMYESENDVFAFEPVYRELGALSHIFDEIVWLGCKVSHLSGILTKGGNPKIKMVVMPSVTNKHLNAFRAFLHYPLYVQQILKKSKDATHIHTRGPSHPATLGILLSKNFPSATYWHKYAGNWKSDKLPFSYKFQQRLLKKVNTDNAIVTANGDWQDNPPHILSMENPCMYDEERKQAWAVAEKKDFNGKLTLLFVGNLVPAKGILNLIDAMLSGEVSDKFEKLYVIGEGFLKNEIGKRIQQSKATNIVLCGSMDRNQLNKYYEQAHVLVLPSESEGFPKVVAEAAAYGCIPIVTDVSAISQYITSENGYLMNDNRSQAIVEALNELSINGRLKEMSMKATAICEKFTYEHFVKRVKNDIFHISE